MSITKILVRVLVGMVGATMLATVSSPSATAATPRNGVCEAGEFCLYFLPNRGGSVSDFTTSVPNYGTSQPTCYEFRTPGLAGYQQCIKNNAESAWNRTSTAVRVYFNSNYCGPSDLVSANSARNLDVTFDDNASHKFAPFPPAC